MAKRVLGVDLSLTGTGLVGIDTVREDNCGITANTITTKKRGMARIDCILEAVARELTKIKYDLVCLEGYSFGSKGRAVFQTGELGGVIRHWLWSEEIPWVEVTPTQVKKFAAGKGNVGKDQVMMQAYKRWGFEAPDNNQADAFVLATIGQFLIGGREHGDLIKPQQDVIKDLKKAAISGLEVGD